MMGLSELRAGRGFGAQQQQQQQLYGHATTRTTTLRQRQVRSNPTMMRTVPGVLNKLTSWTKLGVRRRIRLLDMMLNCALLTPLSVLFQVSLCELQDDLLFKYVSKNMETFLLFAIGLSIEFSCSFWQKYLSSIRYVRERQPGDVSYVVATRIYHFAIGSANVFHYRGVANLYYAFFGTSANAAVQAATTTAIVLSSMKCLRNVLGPPLCVGVDTQIDNFFETSTWFRTKEDVHYKHFADHVSTVTIVTSLCFLHWIAVWAYADALLNSDNAIMSILMSLVIGYVLVTFAYLLEPLAIRISHKLDNKNKKIKLLFEDLFLLFAHVGLIFVWKGHWDLFAGLIYYFPIYNYGVDLTAFYGLMGSFLMMCMLYSSATLTLKGCDFDGECSEGEGVAFGLDYFGEFFREEIAADERRERGCREEAARKRELKMSSKDGNLQKGFFDVNKNTTWSSARQKGKME